MSLLSRAARSLRSDDWPANRFDESTRAQRCRSPGGPAEHSRHDRHDTHPSPPLRIKTHIVRNADLTPDQAALAIEHHNRPNCDAPAGRTCRTRGGKTAAKYHTPRSALVPALREELEIPAPADRPVKVIHGVNGKPDRLLPALPGQARPRSVRCRLPRVGRLPRAPSGAAGGVHRDVEPYRRHHRHRPEETLREEILGTGAR
ncbi:zinc finger domain-containing protein [Streptomyces eurocidicus]|uniref:zinc finger domain-containing protein n=1 Tax=Streptomyces eurocidicus TaxID=66423 RepID=UPI003CC82252